MTVKSITWSWVALMLATCVTGWLAGSDPGLHWVSIGIFLIASMKIGLIMASFMELKSAPWPWRIAFCAWLLVITAIVAAAPWLSAGAIRT